MFIQTEPTPNPATLKFLPGRHVMPAGTADFTSAEDAGTSPLATRLFGIDGVTGVFLGADFVSVTKDDSRDWQVMKPMVLGALMEHFTSGQPVIRDDAVQNGGAEDEDDEIVAKLKS